MMLRLLTLTMTSAVVSAMAQVPVDPQINDFDGLLENSPFKVQKVDIAPIVSPPINKNFTLRGVSRFDDGWRVTLVDMKQPKQRIRVYEKKQTNNDGIRLLRVNQNTSDLFQTTVDLMVNGRKVTVGYNEADLKKKRSSSIVSAVPKIPTRPKPGLEQPATNQAENEANTSPQNTKNVRRPRVRRTLPSQ